ncbi:MAG TPA: hypothetical protein VFW78_05250 [Bacteroidia bacterium]|nr:hypothetical protein [Bacteroidia bacterium]
MKLTKLLIITAFLFPKASLGQTPGMEESLKYVNDKLGPMFEVNVVKGALQVKFYDNGTLFREDEAMCKDLDPKKVEYSQEDKILSVNCKTGLDCVTRVYHIREIRRDYGRVSFAKELDPKSAAALCKAFEHIIRMVNDNKYKSDIVFE